MRILYIDLDCCRPDHFGHSGYARPTSPNLDRIAAEGVAFTHCYCSDSPCLPSRAALFSGRFGYNNGVVAHHGPGEVFRPLSSGHHRDPERPMLADYLWQHGLKTVSFSTFADRHNAWWYCAGWAEQHCFSHKRGQERADEVNAAFLPWLRQNGRADDWFIHLHYFDLHSHYRTPPEWVERFRDAPPPPWPDQATIDRQQSFYGPRAARDLYTGYESWPTGGYHSPVSYMPDAIRTTADLKALIDGYDASLAYADYHIGQVLDTLADLGVLDETAVIVSGDHGDSFGEHGQYMDHGIANEPVHNIPMIVRWPGLTRPGRCEGLIYGLDLAPTLCDLLGLPTPPGWDGRSFAPALRGEPFAGWPYLVWGHGIYTFSRAVRTPDWLLIQMLHPGLYPYDEPVLLHDMRADPHQEQSVASQRPDVVRQLTAHLEEWRAAQDTSHPDPLAAMVPLGPYLYYTPEQMVARLQATGRANRVPELQARLRRVQRNT